MAIVELRNRLNSKSTEIVLPFHINFSINNAKVIVPQRGDRKKLLDLSLQYVRQYKLDKLKQSEKLI
jgi:excinuclease ABC subunit C